ncbi:hypothetical protein ACFV0O_01225 [Kitasatospora sp. NPDC059577]|uniref:hypothetical protein n=1 Tax=Kitasatospora sp. NPDC059577 TaxID=3346873 RepID=UPI00368BA84A
MSVADIGAVLPAVLALPISVLAAWWTRRSGDRAAGATLSAGHSQASAALAAVHVQKQNEQELRQQTALADASSGFLRASDELVATVQRLSEVDHDRRSAQLADHGTAVESAFGPLELLASPDLISRATGLLQHCRRLEKLALDRAVLRSAVAAMEDGWCDSDAEDCDHPEHGSAWVAWCFLVEWPDMEAEKRREERGLLEFCLLESGRMSEEDAARVLALADRCPSSWSAMVGGLVRDPLMERFTSLRTEFVDAARSVRPHPSDAPASPAATT